MDIQSPFMHSTAGSVKQALTPLQLKPPTLLISDNGLRQSMDACYSPMFNDETVLSPMSPFHSALLLQTPTTSPLSANYTPTLFSPVDELLLLELGQLDLQQPLQLDAWTPLSPTVNSATSPMMDLSHILGAGDQTPSLGIDIPYFSPSFAQVATTLTHTPLEEPVSLDKPLSLSIDTQGLNNFWSSDTSTPISSPFMDSAESLSPLTASPTSSLFQDAPSDSSQTDATFRIFQPRKMVKEGQPGIPTDEKPFACHHCPVSFSRKHDLKRHSRIHLGIRPYGCKICGKTFSRMDALSRHTDDRGCKSLKKMKKR